MVHPLIEDFEQAVREHAFKGSQPPAAWEGIEQSYQRAKAVLENRLETALAGEDMASRLRYPDETGR